MKGRCCPGDGLPPNHHSELCAEKNKMSSGGLSNRKNMFFSVNKLLNVGVDLTPRQRDEKK
jgi:hypothetical protein